MKAEAEMYLQMASNTTKKLVIDNVFPRVERIVDVPIFEPNPDVENLLTLAAQETNPDLKNALLEKAYALTAPVELETSDLYSYVLEGYIEQPRIEGNRLVSYVGAVTLDELDDLDP